MDVLKMSVALGGSLTGEHGVGIEKRDLMSLPIQRRRPRPAEARARRVRSAAQLNPAKVFPLEGRGGVIADEVATLTPSDEAEACAMVAEARGRGETLDIVGGGSRAGFGRPPEGTRRLSSAAARRHRLPRTGGDGLARQGRNAARRRRGGARRAWPDAAVRADRSSRALRRRRADRRRTGRGQRLRPAPRQRRRGARQRDRAEAGQRPRRSDHDRRPGDEERRRPRPGQAQLRRAGDARLPHRGDVQAAAEAGERGDHRHPPPRRRARGRGDDGGARLAVRRQRRGDAVARHGARILAHVPARRGRRRLGRPSRRQAARRCSPNSAPSAC